MFNVLCEGGKKIFGDKKNNLVCFVKCWEEYWKGMFVFFMMFEEMGFYYIGLIDGYDMLVLLFILKMLCVFKGLKLLYVMIIKGKGYELVEGDQIGYYVVGLFDLDKGLVVKVGVKKLIYIDVFSDWLCDVVVVELCFYGIMLVMCEGFGLVCFSKEYLQCYFDVVIVEQYVVIFVVGMVI